MSLTLAALLSQHPAHAQWALNRYDQSVSATGVQGTPPPYDTTGNSAAWGGKTLTETITPYFIWIGADPAPPLYILLSGRALVEGDPAHATASDGLGHPSLFDWYGTAITHSSGSVLRQVQGSEGANSWTEVAADPVTLTATESSPYGGGLIVSLTASVCTSLLGHWDGPYFRTSGASTNPIASHTWNRSSSAEGYTFNYTPDMLNTYRSPPGATNQVYPEELFDAPALTMQGDMQPYWNWVPDSNGGPIYLPMETCEADASIYGDILGSVAISGSFPSYLNGGQYDLTNNTITNEVNYTYTCTLAPNGVEADGDSLHFNLSAPSFSNGGSGLNNNFSVAGFLSVQASVQ